MPRAKADNVVIHRIELGGKERDMAESALVAYQFNKIMNPVVNALSDVSFLLFVGGVLAAYKFIDKETWDQLTAGIAQGAANAEEAAVTIIEAGQSAYSVAQQAREGAEFVWSNTTILGILNQLRRRV